MHRPKKNVRFNYTDLKFSYECNKGLHLPFDILLWFEGILGILIAIAFIYNYLKNKIPWSSFVCEANNNIY